MKKEDVERLKTTKQKKFGKLVKKDAGSKAK